LESDAFSLQIFGGKFWREIVGRKLLAGKLMAGNFGQNYFWREAIVGTYKT
jgi:hypothetical protein